MGYKYRLRVFVVDKNSASQQNKVIDTKK